MKSVNAIAAENLLMQTYCQLEIKAQHLVNMIDKEKPKKLLRDAEEVFNTATNLAILVSNAGLSYTDFENRTKGILYKLYQVKEVIAQRRGSLWKKFMAFIKGAMDCIADLVNIGPFIVTGSVLILPQLLQLIHQSHF